MPVPARPSPDPLPRMRPERFRRLQSVLDRRQPDLTVLMEKVHKPRNFSAILRNCDAVGVLEAHAVPPEDGLSLDANVSASASKWIRVVRHDTVKEAAESLKSDGFRLVAAHPADDAVEWTRVDFTRPSAVLVGTELYGLTDEAVALADEVVSVPMMGMIRSLNVSVAAAVLLYEALRQRRAAGLYRESRLSEERYRRILFEWAYPRLARILRREGRPYPPLGETGEILEPLS